MSDDRIGGTEINADRWPEIMVVRSLRERTSLVAMRSLVIFLRRHRLGQGRGRIGRSPHRGRKRRIRGRFRELAANPPGRPLSTAGPQLDRADTGFAKKAAEGGMAEVEFGKLAQQNAQDAQVKQFGQQMEQDHSKANQQLESIASQKGARAGAQQ